MIKVRSDLCPQNHRCPSLYVCPTGALLQIGFRAPTVDEDNCIDCNACTQTCPVFVTE